MNTVCIFSHEHVTHDITLINCSLNYSKTAVWADTDIRFMVQNSVKTKKICNNIHVSHVFDHLQNIGWARH